MTQSGHYAGRARFLVAAVALSVMLPLYAAEGEYSGESFSHKEWDLTCDNTLTCRAAGYDAGETEHGATVLLTRKAGKGTPVMNRVMLAHYNEQEDGGQSGKESAPPDLIINGHSAGALTSAEDEAWKMNADQAEQFLTALKQDWPVSFRYGGQDYGLSAAGSSAVLLKMDDIQGRVNTPGAILRKGNGDESGIRPPVPAPVIIRAPVTDNALRPMTPQEQALIKPAVLELLKADKEQTCMDEYQEGDWQIAQLNQTSSLVSVPCWYAAYNHGDAYFVIQNDMKADPVMVTDSATDYEKGEIFFSMKGRGLGDCWQTQSWVWDGKAFVIQGVNNTGRCQLIRAGGAWDIPEYVSQVKGP